MPKLMLHMHQVRQFIDDRETFYQYYLNGKHQKDEIYFQVGRAIDFATKVFHTDQKNGYDRMYNSKDYKTLDERWQTVVFAMMEGYADNYKDDYFKNYREEAYKVNLGPFVIHNSPDLVAEDYTGNTWIIEIKSSSEPASLIAEDFQTICYAWAYLYKTGNPPKGILKRILKKPTIKQTKKETFKEYVQRLIGVYADKPEKYYLHRYVFTDFYQLMRFEKYLINILKEMAEYMFEEKTDKYKFYKKSDRRWV